MSQIPVNETDSLFEHAFYYAPIGMALVSLSGIWIKVNASLCNILGYNSEEFLVKTYGDITHPDDILLDDWNVNQLLQGEIQSYRMEKRYFHKTGRIVWALLSVSLVRNEHGEPLYFVSQIKDITERKKMEFESRKREQLFQLIAENSLDMIVRHTPDNVCLYISPSCTKILGFEPHEIIGKNMSPFIHPDDAANLRNTSVLTESDEHVLTFRCRRKDGTYIWLESRGKLIRDENNSIKESITVLRDITEQKNNLEQIERLSHRNELVLNCAGEGIFGLDIEGRTEFVNPVAAKMLGYEVNELLGKMNHSFVHHSNPDGTPYPFELCHITKSIKQGLTVHVTDEVFWRKDGTSFPVEYTSTPIMEKGAIVGAVVMFQDISEKNKAQELILHSEKLAVAGQLAAGIAHEIRNPLTAIRGFLQLMKPQLTSKSSFFDIIFSEIGRIELIINELLILAKPQPVHIDVKDIGGSSGRLPH